MTAGAAGVISRLSLQPRTDRKDDMADLDDPKVKMLLYRCKYTGTKETDELLYRFARARVPGMDAGQLARFTALVDDADPDLYLWIAGRRPVPPEWDTDIMAMLQAFTL